MAIEVTKMVWLAPLDKAAKAVLLAYADHVSSDGTGGWPSTARVAQMTSYSERWIYEQRQILQSLGVLVMTKPSTPTKPTVYRIDIDALQRLIDGAEAGSPPELTSARPTGSQFRPPLNGVPLPPESNAPKPPVEPSTEPPQLEQIDELVEARMERIVKAKLERGDPIDNLPAYKQGVRRNIAPEVIEQAQAQHARAALYQKINECCLCNDDGNVAWDDESGNPEAKRCTHDPTDYEDMDLFTRQEQDHRLGEDQG